MSRTHDSNADDSEYGDKEQIAQAMYGGMGKAAYGDVENERESDNTESSEADDAGVDVVEEREDGHVYECEIPDCDGVHREEFDEDHQVPDEIWEHCESCGRDTFHELRGLTEAGDDECAHESVGLTGSESDGTAVCEQYSCTDCGADLRIHVDFEAEEARMEVADSS